MTDDPARVNKPLRGVFERLGKPVTDDPARAEGSGTTTECPLDGVHEHSFRGPHTFTEWYPARPSELLREAAIASFRELHIRYNHSEDFTDCDRPACVDRRAALDATEPGLDDETRRSQLRQWRASWEEADHDR